MADLLYWDKPCPENFYRTITHLWLLAEDGTIEVVRKSHYNDAPKEVPCIPGEHEDAVDIHAEYWGEDAWGNEIRGYYSHQHGIVTCHNRPNQAVIKKLARKFKEAIYINQEPC